MPPRPKRKKRKLAAYRSKRDFKKTAEPTGDEAGNTGHSYLIQKHAARRLHYDFRLEMDGVLKSWAVTRGPSLDPEDKRLAVHVEDHPLAYGGFEGTIPQGEYGGGTVMLWDKGEWLPLGDPEFGYRKGHLGFELKGERLKGRWDLVRMGKASTGKKENWLLIKAKDQYAKPKRGDFLLEHHLRSVTTGRTMEQIAGQRGRAAAKLKAVKPKRKPAPRARRPTSLPAFVAVQLATLTKAPPKGENWVHEIKFDGYRLLAHIEEGKVRLLTRDANDWTGRYPPIAAALKGLKVGNALLDGEVVHQESDGSMSFHALQNASGEEAQQRLHYYVFDLLFLDGEDWRDRPLLERKQKLRELLRRAPSRLHYSEHFAAPGDEVLAHACHIALEGIVSKRADRPYHSGRSLDWMKSKCIQEQEIVIGGYTVQANSSGQLGALLTGYYQKGKLVYSGKVGTGFDQEEGRRLLQHLKALRRDSRPFVSVPAEAAHQANWVTPKLVAQVNFSEWTPEGRMRHPSFQGLREDKPADQVMREKERRPSDRSKVRPLRKAKPRRAETAAKHVVAGVAISHPEKELYPDAHITKGMLVDYYLKIAPLMLAQVAGRPISMLRCPGGEGHGCFFQRHAGEGASPHLQPVKVATKGKPEPYVMIEDLQGLIALVQRDVLEIHMWGSRADAPASPDRAVFDLDPAPDVAFAAVKRAALDLRARLKHRKLESFLKTTGGKGLHVVVPFQKGPSWDEVKAWSRALAAEVVKDAPDEFTINSRKAERHGRIYIDYLRNGLGASAIAPYSTRARPGAPVSLPIDWKELTVLKRGDQFGIKDALRRLRKDPWRRMASIRQRLPLSDRSK